MTPKEDCLALATQLAAAEEASPTPELEKLHEDLRAALYRHAERLGLDVDDLAEIDNVGPQLRGGTNKTPPPEAG